MDEQYEEFMVRLGDLAKSAVDINPLAASTLYTLMGTLISCNVDGNDRYLRELAHAACDISSKAVDDLS